MNKEKMLESINAALKVFDDALKRRIDEQEKEKQKTYANGRRVMFWFDDHLMIGIISNNIEQCFCGMDRYEVIVNNSTIKIHADNIVADDFESAKSAIAGYLISDTEDTIRIISEMMPGAISQLAIVFDDDSILKLFPK